MSSEGKNLNPAIQSSQSYSLIAFENERFKNEMRYLGKNKTDNKKNEIIHEEIDSYEIFDIIRNINDPEHPLTLEKLSVVSAEQITVQ